MTGTVEAPELEVNVCASVDLHAAVRCVHQMFLGDQAALLLLAQTDPLVAELDRRYFGLRMVRQHDLLTALVRAISAQQVNLRWAATTRRRLAQAFGRRSVVASHEVWSLEATRLASAKVAELRALGFTTRKAEYIVGVAEAIAGGTLDLAALQDLSDDDVMSRLTALRGIGVWTAEWILARTLGRPRVVAGDLAVRKAVGIGYTGELLPNEAQVRAHTLHWGAATSSAQTLLLFALAEGTLADARRTLSADHVVQER
jgi:DNA-3-methyladenine glycosylase II